MSRQLRAALDDAETSLRQAIDDRMAVVRGLVLAETARTHAAAALARQPLEQAVLQRHESEHAGVALILCTDPICDAMERLS